MPRPSLPLAVTIAVLLGLGATGCADTPQPPAAAGEVGSGEVPTGTAPGTASATPTDSATSSAPSSSSSTSKASSSSSSRPSQTTLNGTKTKPFPKVPQPDGKMTLDTFSDSSGATTWTRVFSSTGVKPRDLASDLQQQYKSAGYKITQQTNIPGTAGGGKVFVANNGTYNISVVVNTSTSDGAGSVGTSINVTEL